MSSIQDLFANGQKPNILVLITDQQRALGTWPADFAEQLLAQLPAEQRLRAQGLSFDNAVTGACMCSPSRATFLTSNYPALTGATRTGQSTLPSTDDFANLATVLNQAGYTCEWKGKWHLLGGSGEVDGPGAFGWSAKTWDPPDSGTTLGVDGTLGGPLSGDAKPPATRRPSGGPAENDQQYLADAASFLASPPSEPWCLAVNFVNPHDVHVARMASADANGKLISGSYDSGFTTDDFSRLRAPLPSTIDEQLDGKPRAQPQMAFTSLSPTNSAQDYINFYAYLQTLIDGAIGQVLDAAAGADGQLPEDLLIIRFADHGELGLSHGLVEKFYNAYDEAIRVPLVFCNPAVWPSGSGATTTALASLVDLLPTLVSLLGLSLPAGQRSLAGTDLTPVLDDPSAGSVQDAVHFTYDDITSKDGPSVIRAIRCADWSYAVYLWSTDSAAPADWEMYDLSADPKQTQNLAGVAAYGSQQALLDQELVAQMQAKGTMPSGPWPPTYQAGTSRGGPPPSPSASSCSVYDLPGVSRSVGDALVYAGVDTSARLLAWVEGKDASEDAAASLAERVGVARFALAAFVALARLLTLDGVGPGQAQLLVSAGVDDIAALATRDAVELAAALAESVARADADGRVIWYGPTPDATTVDAWIEASRRI